MSSPLSRTSSARPRPIRRGRRAMGPPPGTNPAPLSHCDRSAFSRLAKRMSLARDSSLPTPVARPRIDTIDTTGARLRRTSMSGNADQQQLLALPRAEEIGITLSEEDQLDPEQSTSAIVVHHPQAKYFSV